MGSGRMDVSVLSHLAYVAQLALGIVFLLSALLKLRRPLAFARSAVAYEVLPAAVAWAFGLALIPLEAFVAIALLTGWLIDIALPLAAALLLAFLPAVGINLRRGRRIPCGCFGSASEPISPRAVARLLLLLAVALLVVGFGSMGDAALPRLGSTSADESTLAYAVEAASLSAFLVLLGVWLLGLPEVVFLARHLRWGQPSSATTNGGDGAEGA